MSGRYKYIDTEGNLIENLTRYIVDYELSREYTEWLKGSGDSCIEGNIPELIIVKLEDGIFIMAMDDYSSPLINEEFIDVQIEHYIGGEPFKIPKSCLCDKETAIDIITYYIENSGQLPPSYNWIDVVAES